MIVSGQVGIGFVALKILVSGIQMPLFSFLIGFEVIFNVICHDTPHICLWVVVYFGFIQNKYDFFAGKSGAEKKSFGLKSGQDISKIYGILPCILFQMGG